ncbi:ArnT family glycosyltransferase [Streptacidiphilus melanogenes]|uniref:ArnT family glycosyltransferase n=1 Tax=Streptacidiphilus melanogenes TaxID=411235 RepID=UPI0005A86AF8|nr:glycosyltransferase family 39 protein [Streptacidiphilus melanogenes]
MAPSVTGVLTTPPDSPNVSRATRLRPWRSPADQPGYARPALLGIAALAALLFFWRIDQATFHGFYANAARSGAESWKAFVFGSFDPAGTITLDKLPGFVWPQALSARIFGFHAWSVALPQAVEGVLAVLVLYRAVRQWAGASAALLACGLFTLTPVIAGLFRTSVEDPAFTLLLICAAEAAQRAARTGRLRTLVLSGVWVGLAFQTKMLEAWAVLPALALVYLVSAPAPLRRRLGHVLVAGVVTVAVSASWIALVTLTPAKDRPYVDGTTDNSAYSMVVGYNFLNRFSSVGMSASDTGSIQAVRGGGGHGSGAGARGHGSGGQGTAGQGVGGTGQQGSAGGGGGGQGTSAQSLAAQAAVLGGGGGGDGGWSKMFGSSIASQTGWLYPLAAISFVCGLAWRRRRPRTDPLRAGYLMWGTWLAVFFLAFSAGSVGGHSYYMGVIATPLAALSAAGLVGMWRAYRSGGRKALVLPVAIAATAAWAVWLANPFPTFRPWAAPVAIAATTVALALLAVGRVPRLARPRLAAAGLAAGLLAVVVTPAAWATSVLSTGTGGGMASMMGSVGPSGHGGFAGFAGATRGGAGHREGGGRGGLGGGGGRGEGLGGGFGGTTTLSAAQQQLFSYVTSHDGSARYLMATSSWSTASPFILATGKEVLPMGGFTGAVPSPTLSQFQHLVSTRQLRFVLLGGGMGAGQSSPVQSWVRQSCAVVPPSAYGATAPSQRSDQEGGPSPFGRAGASQQLYSCGDDA